MARMSPTTNNSARQEEDEASSLSSNNKTPAAADLASFSYSGLTSKDVIMGRGAQATDHQGNKELRRLVRVRYGEYKETSKHKEKQRITQEIIRSFQRQGGRFLRPVLPPNSQVNTAAVDSWQVVKDEKKIIDKVKQMLRDVRPQTELKRKLRKRKRPLNEASTEEQQPPPPNRKASSCNQSFQTNATLRQGQPEPIHHTTKKSLSMPAATRQSLNQEGSQNRESNTLSLQELAFIAGEEQRRQVLARQLAQAEQAARLNSMRAFFDFQHPHAPPPGTELNHGYHLLPANTMGATYTFPQFTNYMTVPVGALPNSNTGPYYVTWEETLRQQRASSGAFQEGQRPAKSSERP